VTTERSGRDLDGPSAPEVALTFGAAVLAGCVIILLRQQILPAKFSYDGLRIQAIAAGRVGDRGDKSYDHVGDFYALTGLAQSPRLAGLVGFGLFVWCCCLVLRRTNWHLSWLTLGCLVVATLLGAVFLGWYSKDVLVLPITAMAVTADRRSRVVGVAGAMLVYAAVFRSYWAAIALLFLLFVLVLRRTRHRPAVVLASLLLLGILLAGWGFEYLTGVDVGTLRTSLNADRLGSVDAQTQIPTFVRGGSRSAEALNLVVTASFLFFPVPLLSLGGIYYFGIFILVAGLWLLFFRAALMIRTATGTDQEEGAGRLWHAAIVAYPLAFATVQVLFEPDYGSALRHLAPLLPCMVLVIALAGGAGRAHGTLQHASTSEGGAT
jgi:hypothetical protein